VEPARWSCGGSRPEAVRDNFVEMKKTRLGRGNKANHLAYLGDAEIGRDANIGAGTPVTKDVPPHALAISRVRQENKEGWAKKHGPLAKRGDGHK